jgi:hypothetical protein
VAGDLLEEGGQRRVVLISGRVLGHVARREPAERRVEDDQVEGTLDVLEQVALDHGDAVGATDLLQHAFAEHVR